MALIMTVNQIQRDAEQIMKRCTKLVGSLNARDAREACAPDAQGARQACARVSSLNSNTIKSTDIDGANAQSINHFFKLSFVLAFAKKHMPEIPEWYVSWWHSIQTSNGWTTNKGEPITDKTWRPLLVTWWRNASEKERARIEQESIAAQSAAEANRTYTAADWQPCADAHCFYYNDEKHLCSLLIPAPPKIPRRCGSYHKTG